MIRRYHPRRPLPSELAALTLPDLLDLAHDLEREAEARGTGGY